MQRIPPQGFARVGALTYYARLMRLQPVIDPVHGGIQPLGPPVVVFHFFCAIEPFDLNVVREHVDLGGAMVNMSQYLITCWYRPGFSVKDFVEWDDVRFGRLRQVEILAVRDQAEQHRYLELMCQERVS
jgi:hypothetical protein